MSIKELLDPILDQGIRYTNFFEGRLLTGEDLRNQQEANRQHDRRLGRAIGPGIIEGLEVELLHDGSDGESPTVRVSKGLAINRDGEIFGLPQNDITVALTEPREPPKWDQADFYTCAGPPGMQHLPSGAGVYVLVMSPVAGYKERAPKSGLGDNGIAKGCGSRYVQEGVRFRLVEVSPLELVDLSETLQDRVRDLIESLGAGSSVNSLEQLNQFRNLLAYMCIFPQILSDNVIDPFESFSTNLPHNITEENSTLERLRLDTCDIPLALMFWTTTGVLFIDVWSVRRRILAAPTDQFDFLPGPTPSVADAILRQFQSQLGELLTRHSDPTSVRIQDYFRFLPPAGLVPIALFPSPIGFNHDTFFESFVHREHVFITSAQLRGVFTESSAYLPIDLSKKELMWIYVVRENVWAANTVGPRKIHAVFTSGHMPYYGNARYDLGWWDHANFGEI